MTGQENRSLGMSRTAKGLAVALLSATAGLSLALAPQPLQAAASKTQAKAAADRLEALNRAQRPRPRIIVTSDLEIDDVASWHRFFLYANEFEIVGLVSSSSRFHWLGDPAAGIAWNTWAGHDVFEQIIRGTGRYGVGGGYAAAYPNLRRHDPRYPSPDDLMSKVRLGNITNVGEMAKDTPGSDLIKQALLDDNMAPLHLQAWGGTNTIAAALRSIEAEYKNTPRWQAIHDKVIAKARLYIILDQDTTYKDYILKSWPDLYTIYNRDQFWSVAYANFRNMRTPRALEDQYLGAPFMSQIVKGPLLQTYPVMVRNADGVVGNPTSAAPAPPPGSIIAPPRPPGGGGGGGGGAGAAPASPPPPPPPPRQPGTYASEGDSPAYWYVLNTGLRSDEDPSYGGWGGRFAKVNKNIWTDRPSAIPLPGANVRDTLPGFDTPAHAEAAPQTRWIPQMQHDFLGRAHWVTMAPEAANHEPVVHVSRTERDLSVRPGQRVNLAAQAADPDGDPLDVKWWQYREAGTYAGQVQLASAPTRTSAGVSRLGAGLTVPADAKPGDTIHIITEVTDRGSPTLTRYARFILTVR